MKTCEKTGAQKINPRGQMFIDQECQKRTEKVDKKIFKEIIKEMREDNSLS